MPDLKQIQDEILARLDEVQKLLDPLVAEAEELKKLAAQFEGAPAGAPAASARARRTSRRTPAAKPARATGARRGRPPGTGGRARQAVDKIAEQPGITASQLAKAMGISPNYLYRVLPRLEQEAKVTKQGKGYHPAGKVATPAENDGQRVGA